MLLKIDYTKVESNVRRIYYAWNELGEWLLLLRIHGENGFTRITAGDSFHDFTPHLVQVEFPISAWDLCIRSVRAIVILFTIDLRSDHFLINVLFVTALSSLLLSRIVPMQTILIWKFENYAKRPNQSFVKFENHGEEENRKIRSERCEHSGTLILRAYRTCNRVAFIWNRRHKATNISRRIHRGEWPRAKIQQLRYRYVRISIHNE